MKAQRLRDWLTNVPKKFFFLTDIIIHILLLTSGLEFVLHHQLVEVVGDGRLLVRDFAEKRLHVVKQLGPEVTRFWLE